jgi:uncharacterized protein RhaS with RHS repeats
MHVVSGLTIAPFRSYDPALGRWLSRDLLGESEGVNLYAYCDNNSVNYIDILGLSTDKYEPDSKKHGAPHIDRYTKQGDNVGRYRPDGTPVKHMGKTPPPVPNSDKKKFQQAKDKLKLRDGMLHTTADEALQVLAIMGGGAVAGMATSQPCEPEVTIEGEKPSGGTLIYKGVVYRSVNGILTRIN